MFDDVRPVLGGQASRDVVTADIEGLRYQRSLQIGVNLLRDLVDEQGGDGVHLQQVGLQVGVYEDVESEQIEIVVKRRGGFLHHLVYSFVTTEQGLDDHILHSLPERCWVNAVDLPEVGPQLVYCPLVDLTAGRVVSGNLATLVYTEVSEMDEHIGQILTEQTNKMSSRFSTIKGNHTTTVASKPPVTLALTLVIYSKIKRETDFISSLIVDTELFCGESDESVLVKVNAKRIDARDENVDSKIKLKDES